MMRYVGRVLLAAAVCGSGACIVDVPDTSSEKALFKCSSGEQCSSDHECRGNVCVSAGTDMSCRNTADCIAGLICASGTCVLALPTCASDADCVGAHCLEGVCLAEGDLCAPGNPGGWWCPQGRACHEGSCVDEPNTGCFPTASCGDSLACAPTSATCLVSGESCGVVALDEGGAPLTSSCGPGDVCVSSWSCALCGGQGAACPFGFVCDGGICIEEGAVCGPSGGCTEGSGCGLRGTCHYGGTPCGPDLGISCGSDDVCVVSVEGAACHDCDWLPDWAHPGLGTCGGCAPGCTITDQANDLAVLRGAELPILDRASHVDLAMAGDKLAVRVDLPPTPASAELLLVDLHEPGVKHEQPIHGGAQASVAGPEAVVGSNGEVVFAMACRSQDSRCFGGSVNDTLTYLARFEWSSIGVFTPYVRKLTDISQATEPNEVRDVALGAGRLAVSTWHSTGGDEIAAFDLDFTPDFLVSGDDFGPISLADGGLYWSAVVNNASEVFAQSSTMSAQSVVTFSNQVCDLLRGEGWTAIVTGSCARGAPHQVHFVDNGFPGEPGTAHVLEVASERTPKQPVRAGGHLLAWARNVPGGVEIRAVDRRYPFQLQSGSEGVGLVTLRDGENGCNQEWHIEDFVVEVTDGAALHFAYVAQCWNPVLNRTVFRTVYTRQY